MEAPNKRDWILLALAAAEGKPLSPVQLQKALFLLGESIPGIDKDQFYKFVPYNYGPFDAQVYADAEDLRRLLLVSIQSPEGQRWKQYAITAPGQVVAKEIEKRLDSRILQFVKDLVGWVLSLRFDELLRYIYTKYPRFRDNSVFQG